MNPKLKSSVEKTDIKTYGKPWRDDDAGEALTSAVA